MSDYVVADGSLFKNSERAIVREYGDKIDPWWGLDTIELSKEDLEALLDGKLLESSCNSEYGLLIRLKEV